MAFMPSDYTLATVPLLGIVPEELLARAKGAQYFTLWGLLEEYDIEAVAWCGDNTDVFANVRRWSFQPGLVIGTSDGEMLVVCLEPLGDVPLPELGAGFSEAIGEVTLVSTSYCDPLVILSEF